MKNFVIVTTGSGGPYARRISRSIMSLQKKERFNVKIVSFGSRIPGVLSPEDTIIHLRAAYPDPYGWMQNYIELEEEGYKVVNSTECALITSNKIRCAKELQNHIAHPKTWALSKGHITAADINRIYRAMGTTQFILKPTTSMSQGSHVQRGDLKTIKSLNEFLELVNKVPGDMIIMQEFVPYVALHRTIVIDGKALPFSFVDKPQWHPDNWKVSVCLNKMTMKYSGNPDKELLRLSEDAQRLVGGEINFIDVFETARGYVMGEINTACNLHIHEMLAKRAGQPLWNIHRKIARTLIKKVNALGEQWSIS